jgi:hypothetical protein
MKKFPAICFGMLLAAACGVLAAAPAPWFKWRSKVDRTLVCSQTPLGSGWEKALGPFQDSHCEKLIANK